MDPRLAPLARIADPFERRLALVAVLTDELRRRGAAPPIVVGGHALEIFTRGGISTRDVDLVVADTAAFEAVCRDLGLTRFGRHFADAVLGVAVEAPGSEIPERVIEVLVGETPVRVEAVEELVIDRLNAYARWCSAADGDAAEMLLALHAGRLDAAFLARRAKEEDVEAALAEVRARLIDEGERGRDSAR